MADVCLVLEGTYPRVTGGVSEWIQRLLEGLADATFSVVHLGTRVPTFPHAYAPPANLLSIADVLLDPERPHRTATAEAAVPEAGIYHALSTGFAGLVGGRVAAARDRPFLLTEHGIYSREARLGAKSGPGKVGPREWAQSLDGAAREAYARARTITTVCEANTLVQRRLGAPPAKLETIDNAAPALSPAREGERAGALRAPRIGFIGRVVPTKDVVTFVRAARLVQAEFPEAEPAVVGPLGHTPAYAARCRELATALGLGERLVFTGETDPMPWYRRLDVVVLTSVSEGQPLVALEAMAAGVPVVATAVGGCPRLLGGPRPAGLLTPVGDPAATAAAIARICRDPALRAELARNGRERARGRHAPERLLTKYRALYEAASDGR